MYCEYNNKRLADSLTHNVLFIAVAVSRESLRETLGRGDEDTRKRLERVYFYSVIFFVFDLGDELRERESQREVDIVKRRMMQMWQIYIISNVNCQNWASSKKNSTSDVYRPATSTSINVELPDLASVERSYPDFSNHSFFQNTNPKT